jgi:hypothetical protein
VTVPQPLPPTMPQVQPQRTDEALRLLELACPEILDEGRRQLEAEAKFALTLRRLAADVAVELLIDTLEDTVAVE